MSEPSNTAAYPMEPGDKATAVFVYTAEGLIIGDVITRSVVRVSTWLRTPGLPDYASIYSATVTRIVGGGDPVTLQFPEYHCPVAQIIALHLAPPADEGVDYDTTEQNRKMEPISAFRGPFRFDGVFRMPQHLTLSKQMSLLRDPFLGLYDTTVTSAISADLGATVPMVLLRPSAFMFGPGKSA